MCTFGLYSDNKGWGLLWNRRVACVMLLISQEVNQQCKEDVRSLHKWTQSLFLIRQHAPAPSRMCRSFWVTSGSFPVCTGNVFLQFYSSDYPQGCHNPVHKTHSLLLPEGPAEPSASCCSTYGCCRLTLTNLPMQDPPGITQRTQFNRLDTALHLQRVTGWMTVFLFPCWIMQSPAAPHGTTPLLHPSLHIWRGQAWCLLSLLLMTQLLRTGLEEVSIIPRVFPLGTGNVSRDTAVLVQTRIRQKAGFCSVSRIIHHLHHFLVFVYIFSTMLKFFSIYLEKQHSPTYPLWDNQYEPLGTKSFYYPPGQRRPRTCLSSCWIWENCACSWERIRPWIYQTMSK